MNFIERPLIITDLETTGLNPLIHEVIEIGALKVDQRTLDVLNIFDLKVRPRHIETAEIDALVVNGYNEYLWETAVDAPAAAEMFDEFVGDGVLTAWGDKFEYSFLASLWASVGKSNAIERFRYTFDIPSMVWAVLPALTSIHKNDVAMYLSIPPEAKPHRAYGGALHEWRILQGLRHEQRRATESR